ncbi:BTBD3-like protein [Mya arenaria]|uniref:BTBD3-like protein n=1 Tax=Mya arenaria TaxID=6604 RepID=A0ABY7EIR7_MYAAR|nr:BTB/POZ domain-containing protein 3-like [Mya arenaria]WAR09780.1 BTBD3-like protein [Mya arenaria]
MATKTKDWRSELTASGCLKHLVQEKLFTDVKFIFPNDNNESCTGHKLILSMRSAVFEAMFYGSMSKGDDEVTISDIDKKTFEMVLRYVYTDELEVDGETVLKCLYAAKKYCIDGMVKLCSDVLEASVAVVNVCSNYEHAKLYELQGLHDKCKTFMVKNATEILQDDDFFNLTNESLADYLANGQLKADEALYFVAANRWSENECSKMKIEKSPENKQKVLGPALMEIKFGLLSTKEFEEHVSPTRLLSPEEQDDIYKWIQTKKWPLSDITNKFKSLPRESMTLSLNVDKSNRTESRTLHNNSQFSLKSTKAIQITSVTMRTALYTLSSVKVNAHGKDKVDITLSNICRQRPSTYEFKEPIRLDGNTPVTVSFRFQNATELSASSSLHEPWKTNVLPKNVNHKHYKPFECDHIFGGLIVSCTEYSEFLSTINFKIRC